MGVSNLAEEEIDGAVMYLDFLPVDEQRVEGIGQITPGGTLFPVVFGGHRPRLVPDVGRQRGPDDQGVKVTRVVREVDPLTGIGLTVDPAGGSAAE